MGRIGYARVSTLDQHPEVQARMLEDAGCERVFTDYGVSGAKASRPELASCLGYLRRGDTLVVTKLDRLGRSVRNLCELAEQLRDAGVDLVATTQGIDTTTPAGKLVFHILAAIAEFERDLTVERTREGLAHARADGRVGGRPRAVDPDKLAAAIARRERGQTMGEIAAALGIGRSTLYRALAEASELEETA